jgi:hypothetical protein
MPIDYFSPINSLKALPNSRLWFGDDQDPNDPNNPDASDPSVTVHPPLSSVDAGPSTPVTLPTMPRDTSSDLYGVQDVLKADAQKRKFNADRFGDTNESAALSGLIKQYQNEQDTGSIGMDIAQRQKDEAANADAMRQGFGGNPNAPSAQAGQFSRNLDTMKATMPLQVEQAKGAAEANQRNQAFANMLKLRQANRNPGGAGATTPPGQPGALLQMPDGSQALPPEQPQGGAPAPAGGAPVSPAGPNNGAPYKSPTWHDIMLGGPTAAKYGTLGDMLGAAGEYGKYLAGALPADNPFSDTMVNTSVANLKQIETMFPGIRGIATLIPLFQQHQGALGREMPVGTYGRINSMLNILNDTDQSIAEATGQIKIGANGYPQMINDPVAITRAQQMARDVRQNLQRAKAQMESMYPGIGTPQNSGAPGNNPLADQSQPAAPSSRFQRIQ